MENRTPFHRQELLALLQTAIAISEAHPTDDDAGEMSRHVIRLINAMLPVAKMPTGWKVSKFHRVAVSVTTPDSKPDEFHAESSFLLDSLQARTLGLTLLDQAYGQL